MNHKINIAIDGTSGVGKSTIADIVAQKLDMTHLDTGAMYRCVAYYLVSNHVDIQDPTALEKALHDIHIRFDDKVVYLNDVDVSKAIRTNEISMATSKVAALEPVRKKMVALQQEIAKEKGYILDGRDICTVVLPAAEVKIFMSASPSARADRRYKEYISQGIDANYDEILHDIEQRDYQDSHRTIGPLKKADDATEIDTSNMNIQQVVEAVLKLIPVDA
ncbi:MAG: (d)CMP kinase [Absicoccus porci]|uniref:(d)CMP kinase n=1 Tax=Absicoccus porci TaxID=2486576 RepID=UPI00240A83F7|nr:(d)CMP kinase [Absicoccus porci]MDD6459644.1 (d)CMP kinase [Absicoccus porci]